MSSAAQVILNGGEDIEYIDAYTESDKENYGYDTDYKISTKKHKKNDFIRRAVSQLEPNIKNKLKEEQANNQLKKDHIIAKVVASEKTKKQNKNTNQSEKKEAFSRQGFHHIKLQQVQDKITQIRKQPVVQLYIPDIDADCKDEFYQYFPDIIQYLWNREFYFKNSKNFLSKNDLSAKTRATLNNWMVQVQLYLNIRTESLHLSVAICDAYLSKASIELSSYQLLGITSLFIASKIIERFPPSPSALCYLTEKTFKPNQLIKMERQILSSLMFQIFIPISHNFLSRGLLACVDISNTTKMEYFCYYLFDLILHDRRSADSSPSLRSAAAIYVARAIFHGSLESWTATLEHYTSYLAEDLTDCVKCYVSLLLKVEDNSYHYRAAFEKFSSSRYKQIALSPEIKKSPLLRQEQ